MQEVRRAATLVLVRDHPQGLQTLLLRRHPDMRNAGGSWVFPGGAMDPEDGPLGDDEQLSAKRAAVRETWEESALQIDTDALLFLSHWTTPAGFPSRFATWFFLAEGDDSPVIVDGEEMDDALWAAPDYFLNCHQNGQMPMLPPTLVTLTELGRCASVAAVRAFYSNREPLFIQPNHADTQQMCVMLPGDAGFISGDHTAPGARNRCYLEGQIWRYVTGAEE